jgi:hypothetical protein
MRTVNKKITKQPNEHGHWCMDHFSTTNPNPNPIAILGMDGDEALEWADVVGCHGMPFFPPAVMP